MYHNNTFFQHRIYCPEPTVIQLTKSFCLTLILKGSGQLKHNGKTVRLDAGDCYFFPADTLYTRTCTAGTILYELSLSSYYWETLCPELAGLSLRHFHINENIGDKRSVTVYQRIGDFVASWLEDEDPDTLCVISRLNDLVSIILKTFSAAGNESQEKGDYIQERISHIIRYISSNYESRITVLDISRAIGLNPQYFSTFFVKHFGQTFVDFLNDYRVNRSLHALVNSEIPITEIALSCGFGTYKSFINAFKKAFGITPSEFRISHFSETVKDCPFSTQFPERHLFDFLQSYSFNNASQSVSVKPATAKDYSLDLTKLPVLSHTFPVRAINVGSAYLLLQDKVYGHLKKAVEDCHFTHVHFRDLFCDMLTVYTESVPDEPVFSWDNVNDILERISVLGISPFIEIGFMPRELAASKETLGFGYHPCIGLPKSMKLWKKLIRSFLDNITHRYTADELDNWLFDFWNSANIKSSDGFWTGTKDELFNLYFETFQVFREYSLEHLLGTPNFSIPTGLAWYEDFLYACSRRNIYPGFFSVHIYSCPDNLENFTGIFPASPTSFHYLTPLNPDIMNHTITHLKGLLKKTTFPEMPIIFSEWNITYFFSDLIRDTAFMATYIINTWAQTLSQIKGLTFSSLSDISEYTRPSSLVFAGYQGILGKNGMPKPAYHAFFLLQKMDCSIIWNQDSCLISRGKNRWHILFFNLCESNIEQLEDKEYISDTYRYNVFNNSRFFQIHGSFSLPEGTYQITTYEINQQYGCPYDAWLDMGCPDSLNSEITNALFHASYPRIHYEKRKITRIFHTNITLEPHAVILYELILI